MYEKHFEKDIWDHFFYDEIKQNKIFFYSNGELISIKIEDVLYFEYFNESKDYPNRTTVLYTSNKKVPIKATITSIFEELPATIFSIPHRAYIVNLGKVKALTFDCVILDNDVSLPISQKRIGNFKNELKFFAERNGIFLN